MFAQGTALNNKAGDITKIDQSGSVLAEVHNKGDAAIVLSAKKANGRFSYLSGYSNVVDEAIVDDDNLVNLPVVPGSVRVESSGFNDLVDVDEDGILYWDRVENSELINGTDGATAGKVFTSAGSDFIAAGVVPGDLLVVHGQDGGSYTIESLTTTTLTVDVDFPVGGLSTISFNVYANKVSAGLVNYFTGEVNLSYPSDSAPGSKASVVGTESFTIDLNPGMTVTADVDGGGAATATFDAGQATLAGSGGTFAAMASESFEVQFEDDDVQTVLFGTEGTLQAAVDLINTQIVGGDARINVDQIDIVSDKYGTSSRVRTTNVDAGITTKLGIADAGDESGTGDAADIKAVTFAEAKALIEADIKTATPGDLVLVTLDDTGGMRISASTSNTGSSSTLELGGTGASAFGLSTTAVTGDSPGAFIPVTATYIQGVSVAAGSKTAVRFNVGADDNVLVKAAMDGENGIVTVKVA